MATPEEKERNERLRRKALDEKFARETKQTSNGKQQNIEETPEQIAEGAAKALGGISGKGAETIMGRKRQIDKQIEDAGG